MRKNQWNVLGWGFLIIGVFILIFKETIIKSILYLGIETGGTTDLATLSILWLFILNMISLIFGVLAILFWINAWLEGQEEEEEWSLAEQFAFVENLDNLIKKEGSKELKKEWERISYLTPEAKSFSNFRKIAERHLVAHKKEKLINEFQVLIVRVIKSV